MEFIISHRRLAVQVTGALTSFKRRERSATGKTGEDDQIHIHRAFEHASQAGLTELLGHFETVFLHA